MSDPRRQRLICSGVILRDIFIQHCQLCLYICIDPVNSSFWGLSSLQGCEVTAVMFEIFQCKNQSTNCILDDDKFPEKIYTGCELHYNVKYVEKYIIA